MATGRVSSVWRYPAKSMMGDAFDALVLGEAGVIGDRGWAVRDEVRGGIRGAKKIGSLMRLHARYLEEPEVGKPVPAIEITTPDGDRVRSDDADVNDRLSAFLDHPVSLWPLQPPTDLDHYRRGAADSDDLMTELMGIFGREPGEPLPTFEGLPMDVLMEYESPPGSYFDAFPILLVTNRSLASLAEFAPGSSFDPRRFRPNVVIDTETNGANEASFPEQEWIGRRVTVGEVEFEVTATCPRCVMVTRDFGDLPEDRQVLRTIVKHADQNVGVYATVVRPGTIRAGDEVAID
ncbi:MAG TPA: MOSC domain-containing protein [Acidimicrobiia bacterium]|nr:MOSC domain-containing protein [Acidimicrobiia bacterium]